VVTVPGEREQAIRERAYAIWEQAGYPNGNDVEHWLEAEVEVDSTRKRNMPMQVNYMAAYRLHGLVSLPEDEVELLVLHQPITRVILTIRPDDHFLHLDRQGTIAQLFLNLLFGKIKGESSALIDAGMRSAKEARDKQGTGVFLIVTSTCELREPNFTHRAERDDFILCFDEFSKTAFRDRLKTITNSVLAAVSVSLKDNLSRQVTFVGDVTYAIDPTSHKPIYSFKSHLVANATVSGALDNQSLESIRSYAIRLVNDETLERVVRLLVNSHETKDNMLQSFIEVWAALEIFVNSSFKTRYEQEGRAKSDKHYLSDKFQIISSILDRAETKQDNMTFKQLNRIRNKLHTGGIVEMSLPVEKAQHLLAKYLRLHVGYHVAG
jgi:hypothetical protein